MKLISAGLPVTLLLATTAVAQSSAREGTPRARAQAALDAWDIDEARALAAKVPAAAGRCLIDGTIANRENRLDLAIATLRPCLDGPLQNDPAGARAAYANLYDSYLRAGRYGDQFSLVGERLRRPEITDDERKTLQGDLAMAEAMRRLPQPSVTWTAPTRLPTYKSDLGLRNVDLTINGAKARWAIDTGANFSIVAESLAKRMGLTVHDTAVSVVGSSGVKNPFQVAVIPELALGTVKLQNVAVLIVPDAALTIKRPGGDYLIEAGLGLPALAALGQFSIDRAGTLTIDPGAARLDRGARLYMKQLMPVVEGTVEGQRMMFEFDTGAVKSSFYAGYRDHFAASAKTWRRKTQIARGLGGERPDTVLIQPTATIQFGDWRAIEKDVGVEIDTVKPGLFGIVGQPIFEGAASYTIDFRSMRLLITGATPPG